jgi:Domain of unknown function (DUF4253)
LMVEPFETMLASVGLQLRDLSIVLDWQDGRPIWSSQVSPNEAEFAAGVGREHAASTGVWPFLLFGDANEDNAMTISAGSASGGALAGQAAVDEARRLPIHDRLASSGVIAASPPRPQRPQDTGIDLLGPRPLTGEVLWVPVDHPAEVLGRLGFGGWNDCPSPGEQVAYLSFLHDAAGMVAIGGTATSVVLDAGYPPSEPEAVRAIAGVLLEYCSELRTIGLDRVADALADGPATWQLWWD